MTTTTVIPQANATRSTFCVEFLTCTGSPRGRRPRIFADLDIRIVDMRPVFGSDHATRPRRLHPGGFFFGARDLTPQLPRWSSASRFLPRRFVHVRFGHADGLRWWLGQGPTCVVRITLHVGLLPLGRYRDGLWLIPR
jgi:hypothetical protein